MTRIQITRHWRLKRIRCIRKVRPLGKGTLINGLLKKKSNVKSHRPKIVSSQTKKVKRRRKITTLKIQLLSQNKKLRSQTRHKLLKNDEILWLN